LVVNNIPWDCTNWTIFNCTNWTSPDRHFSSTAAHRSPNCIRKTKNTFCGTWVSVSFPKFCKKNCFQCKNSLKPDEIIGCWPKRTFKTADVRHLETFIFGHPAVIEFQMCCCVPNFSKIGWFFVEIWRFYDLQIAIWRTSAILNFRNLEFMSNDLYRYAILLPCTKFQ